MDSSDYIFGMIIFMRLHFYVANHKFTPRGSNCNIFFYFPYIRVTPLIIDLGQYQLAMKKGFFLFQ